MFVELAPVQKITHRKDRIRKKSHIFFILSDNINMKKHQN